MTSLWEPFRYSLRFTYIYGALEEMTSYGFFYRLMHGRGVRCTNVLVAQIIMLLLKINAISDYLVFSWT